MSKVYTLLFLILLINNDLCAVEEKPTVGPTLKQQLDRAHRNSLCCSKKMRCCKKLPPPHIELRAVIVRCTKPPLSGCRKRYMTKPLNKANEFNIKGFEGFDEDEPLVQSVVTKCHKKVVLTMKIKNQGPTNTKSQFIVIDHVYDSLSGRAVQLLNPYVIKLKQEHVSQTYGLKFLDFVNSNAREQVYNKHDNNYTGCTMDEKKATCGVVKYHGKVIPYSQGFCCSCDAQKNADRQPETAAEQQPYIEQSDPAYLFDAISCPRTYVHDNKSNKTLHSEKEEAAFRSTKRKTATTTSTPEDNKRRQINENNREEGTFRNEEGFAKDSNLVNNNYKIQTMNDEYEDTMLNLDNTLLDAVRNNEGDALNGYENTKKKSKKERDADSMKSSKHSFFTNNRDSYVPGKLYSGNKKNDFLNNEIFEEVEQKPIKSKRQVQSSGVQIRGGQNCADRYTPPHLNPETYHESSHCLRFSPVWYGVYKLNKPLIEQEMFIQIFEKYETISGEVKWKDITNGKRIKLGTFFSSYRDELPTISFTYESEAEITDFCLDINKYRLLIPEGIKNIDVEHYPEARGGPSEFLILKANQIYMSGDQCDSPGVGFEAFYKQPNRCSMPKGTCLRHQPKHLWLHDKSMERQKKKGCYFLHYHGQLSKDPIRTDTNSSEKYLALNYYGLQVSVIEMEINADFNAVLRPQSSAVITEVYVDSTRLKITFITIKITNSGLLASIFFVRISDCPLDIQGKLKEILSKPVLIAPQNQHVFNLNISNDFSADIFFCSVEALDSHKEIVALRRIRIQLLDRCICTWHCLCACIGSSHGLKCIPMQVEHYHAAGFLGGLPVVSYAQHVEIMDDIITLLFYMLLFILFTLFLLGLTKALIGLCCLPVGMWGLNVLLDLPKQMSRYYEDNLRNRIVEYDEEGWPVNPDTRERVRNIPSTAEFCTNVLFFFTYPAIVLLLLFRRLCCPICNLDRYWKKRKKWKQGSTDDFSTNQQECQADLSDEKDSVESKQADNNSEMNRNERVRIKISIKDNHKKCHSKRPGKDCTGPEGECVCEEDNMPRHSSGDISSKRNKRVNSKDDDIGVIYQKTQRHRSCEQQCVCVSKDRIKNDDSISSKHSQEVKKQQGTDRNTQKGRSSPAPKQVYRSENISSHFDESDYEEDEESTSSAREHRILKIRDLMNYEPQYYTDVYQNNAFKKSRNAASALHKTQLEEDRGIAYVKSIKGKSNLRESEISEESLVNRRPKSM